jgi:hypothetical protein
MEQRMVDSLEISQEPRDKSQENIKKLKDLENKQRID